MNYFFNFQKLEYLKGRRPSGCILCLIRDDSPEVPNLTVFSTSLFNVSLNLYPYNAGHLLVFPNRHLVDIRQFSKQEEVQHTLLIRMLLTALDHTHSPSAYNVGFNIGPDAGASIDHVHLHIIPRYPRELGLADLIAGKRVLVEEPRKTLAMLKEEIGKLVNDQPFSSLMM